ncbi:hypothetical protein FRC03_007338 [Tulasnella sp. 419]|nr:hypothetical protein FRC03_007338 [Tulasnella sp. 419]
MARELSQNLVTITSLRKRLDEEVQFREKVSNENKVLLPTINASEDGRKSRTSLYARCTREVKRVEVSSCTGSIQILEAKREALLNVNEVDLISTIQDEHVSVLPRKINALEKKILEDRDVAQLVSRLEEELKREQVTSSIF